MVTLSMRGEIVEVREGAKIIATIVPDKEHVGSMVVVSELSITAIPGDIDDDQPLALMIKFGIDPEET